MKRGKEIAISKFVWPRAAVLRLINLWRENELLYNPNHQLFNSRRERADAILQMANELRKHWPEITRSEVKKKISSIRDYYGRQLSRLEKNITRVNSDYYVPSVYWFWEMEFIRKFYKGKRFKNSNEKSTEKNNDFSETHQMSECNASPLQDFERSSVDSCISVSSQKNPPLLPRNSAPLRDVEILYSIKDDKDIKNANSAFSNYIKLELKEISNRHIKDQLMEQIMALFDAKKRQKLTNTNYRHPRQYY